MFETIALAFQGIWNHKTRSFLTMLGIIIGIAAIITIVSTIKGTNDQIKEKLIGSGDNVVTIQLTSTDGGYLDYMYGGSMPEGVDVFTEEDRNDLLNLQTVSDAAFYVYRQWVDGCSYKNTSYDGGIKGIDANYLRVMGYTINYGRGFTDKDFDQQRKVVIIDTKTMSSLFEGRNPIGRIIEIGGEPFTVVGVCAKSSSKNLVINSIEDYYRYSGDMTGCMYIPMSTWSTVYSYDEVCTCVIRATSTDDMTDAGDNAAKLLTSSAIHKEGYQYKADNLLEQAAELQELSNSTNQQLIWIAGISLLVGGIGVMNIMLVSVTERTREIGLKKAIGAKRRRILWQFLTEAAVLTSLGGIMGVGAGIGLAQMISEVMGTPAAISIPACVVAVGFSVLIGIVFGLIPAVKASRLNPIDALRRE